MATEAAEPLGIPVLPVVAYGINGFGAYPGSPTLRLETFAAVIRDILQSLYGQGFRRFLIANVLRIWIAAVDQLRDRLESGWPT